MISEQIPIGIFSQMTQLTRKALRIYEKNGLLEPDIKDPMTNYRYYSIPQIERGIRIKLLSSMGFSLAEISELLESAEKKDFELIKKLFSERVSKITTEIERLNNMKNILLGNMKMEVFLDMHSSKPIIKEITSTRVISKTEKGPIHLTISKLIGEVFGQIYKEENRQLGVVIVGPPMALYHDMEYKEMDATIEIAVPIRGRIKADEGFEIKELPAIKAATTMHTGAYQYLMDT
ncbi:MAG: MerR family transcriptional regulator, partial [Candidatus Lokiarchaeota archaeon]|nr:MerR family transcriptional regulator [Candidatus Lokiarchaeota archaeon]